VTFPITLSDGTSATVDGPPAFDLSLPVVILMHGLGGTSADMTAPLTNYPAAAFDRSAGFSLYNDAGVHLTPPVTPVAGFFIDPVLSTVTSWNTALKAAGFTTVTYNQSGPLIANDVTQLSLLAAALASESKLAGATFAFVAHSRGGLVVRSFLTAAIRSPALAGFMTRTTTLITLHSPNAGSGLTTVAASVNALAARLQMAIAMIGLPPLGALATLRLVVGNPSQVELAPGSMTLAGIAAGEPVPGITYHTFGGTSTDWVRVWANVFTPESMVPALAFLGLPLPFFHWSTSSVVVGSLLNYGSFVPTEVLVGATPVVTETMAILAALEAATPELAPGVGDTFVTEASARLPFSATHTTKPLNHLEALYDPALQREVIEILLRLRSPLFSGMAIATLHPFPAHRSVSTPYTVTVVDALSGVPLTPQSITVRGPHGVLLTRPASSFTFKFVPEQLIAIDPDTRHPVSEQVWPSVQAQLGSPYGTVGVPTGLP
jgi:hypothetical protein